MDYPNHNMGNYNYENNRPNGMATAAFVLGIVGLATFCCVYTPIVCGALAIILALLSRGGGKSMSVRAKTGLILGIISVAVGFAMLVFSFAFLIIEYGSLGNYMDAIYEMYDLYDTNPYSTSPSTLSIPRTMSQILRGI